MNKKTELSVWFLDLTKIDVDKAQALLSADEQQRQERFLDPDKSHEFTCTRASLRLAIERVSDIPAKELEFNYAESGKPHCINAPQVSFNVSHSHMHALIAVHPEKINLGVDIEYFREVDVDGLSRRFFSQTEQALLLSRVDHHLLKSFFTIWTRKEACVKAHGKGISLGLQTFSVNYDLPARILDSTGGVDPKHQWVLTDVSQGDDHAACICTSEKFAIHVKDESDLWS